MVSFNLLGKKWTFDQDTLKYLAVGLVVFYVLRMVRYFAGKLKSEESGKPDSGSGKPDSGSGKENPKDPKGEKVEKAPSTSEKDKKTD